MTTHSRVHKVQVSNIVYKRRAKAWELDWNTNYRRNGCKIQQDLNKVDGFMEQLRLRMKIKKKHFSLSQSKFINRILNLV